jgi:hypothetical protein
MSEPEYPVPLGRVFLRKDGPSPDERTYVNSLIELIDHKYQRHDLAVFGRRPGRIERERIWPNDHTINWAGQPTNTEDYCSVGAFKRGLENWCGPRKRADIEDVFEDLVISRDDWDGIVMEIELRGFRDLRHEEHAPTRDQQLSSLATYIPSQVPVPAGSVAHEWLSTKVNQLKKALEAYGRKPDIADAAVIKWLKHRELALHISIDGKVRPDALPPPLLFWSTPQAKQALITGVVPTKYLDVKAGVAMVIGSEFGHLVQNEFPDIGWRSVPRSDAVHAPSPKKAGRDLGASTTTVRRNEKRNEICEAVERLQGTEDWKTGTDKKRCIYVEESLDKPRGWCTVTTLRRAISGLP